MLSMGIFSILIQLLKKQDYQELLFILPHEDPDIRKYISTWVKGDHACLIV